MFDIFFPDFNKIPTVYPLNRPTDERHLEE